MHHHRRVRDVKAGCCSRLADQLGDSLGSSVANSKRCFVANDPRQSGINAKKLVSFLQDGKRQDGSNLVKDSTLFPKMAVDDSSSTAANSEEAEEAEEELYGEDDAVSMDAREFTEDELLDEKPEGPSGEGQG